VRSAIATDQDLDLAMCSLRQVCHHKAVGKLF